MMQNKILFVCTGNTCRSPMAAGIFNALAEKKGLTICAESAGILATPGGAEPNAVEAAKLYGADLSAHRTRRFERSMLNAYDRIYCMTAACADTLKHEYPVYAEKILTISDHDLTDPYGLGLQVYLQTAAELFEAAERLLVL
jgi:protein-tyrosine-phosphatase